MDLKKVVLNHINTFPEVDFLKKILEELPKSYNPFPQLRDEVQIGAMLFGEEVFLSPMVDLYSYDGTINIPDGSTNVESFMGKGDENIIGAKFNHKGRDFIIYRTETKHKNP